jgi:hypothetical protein
VVGPHQRYLRIECFNNLRLLANVDEMMIMMMLLDRWPLEGFITVQHTKCTV